MSKLFEMAAYGGSGWSPRVKSLRDELGDKWAQCGVDTEWSQLNAVLLHHPGPELQSDAKPDAIQMICEPDSDTAREQHASIARAYRQAGVEVHYVNPESQPPPNLMFVADLMFMTPEGAILARPASTVRAGEEQYIAQRLAQLRIPILRSIRGNGTFEGADAMWIDPQTVLLATGLRTNREGADQVTSLLNEMGIDVIQVGLAFGTMHLMGQLRIFDRDLAVAWPGRVPYAAVDELGNRGFTVLFLPDEEEAITGMALNFVTLKPREILMPAGNPNCQDFYETAGITCHTVQIDELLKAAGGIGCLTGILERQPLD